MRIKNRNFSWCAVNHGCGPMARCLRPWGGGALYAAAAVIGRGGELVPVHGCMGWQHDLQTRFLPASLPWPRKQHVMSFYMCKYANSCNKKNKSWNWWCVWVYILYGFTLTNEETGKVAKSVEAFAPGWYETTCSDTSPWNRKVRKCLLLYLCRLIDMVRRIVWSCHLEFVQSIAEVLQSGCLLQQLGTGTNWKKYRRGTTDKWTSSLGWQQQRAHTRERKSQTNTHPPSSRWRPPL